MFLCKEGTPVIKVINIIIVDSISILRNSIKYLLESEPSIKVIGSASDSNEAFRLCKKLNPDILLMSLRLNDKKEIKTIIKLKKQLPQMHVIVFSEGTDRDEALLCIKAGIDGYLLKGTENTEIISVLKNTCLGILSFPKSFIKIISAELECQTIDTNYNSNIHLYQDGPLNFREVKLTRMILQNTSNDKIAETLATTTTEVDKMISEIYSKLNIKTPVQLALYAAKNYIV